MRRPNRTCAGVEKSSNSRAVYIYAGFDGVLWGVFSAMGNDAFVGFRKNWYGRRGEEFSSVQLARMGSGEQGLLNIW